MPELIVTVVGAILVYLFGRWQGEHQLLYQRRVEVIEKLFDQLEDVNQDFYTLFHFYGGGQREQAERAAESFNAMQSYYNRKSIWLPIRVSNRVSNFLARYRQPFIEFTSAVLYEEELEPGYVEEWNRVWYAFRQESPEIKQALETEFRAAYGSWRAKFAILLEYMSASRQDQKSTSESNRS
jgi:hypothetical protein